VGATSLRGLTAINLQVEVLREGVHSGLASGIVPNPFMILRKLLDRLEDADTGAIRLAELHVPIPEERIRQAEKAAEVLGGAIVDDFPLLEAVHVLADDPVQLLLNNSWRPALAVTGQDGMPSVEKQTACCYHNSPGSCRCASRLPWRRRQPPPP
jgi:hypothetical protein